MSRGTKKGLALAILALGIAVMGWHLARSRLPTKLPTTSPRDEVNKAVREKVATFQRREQKMAETLWAVEMRAQALGRIVEGWWNQVNASPSKLETLAAGMPTELLTGEWDVSETLPHLNIKQWRFTGDQRQLSWDAWKEEIHRAIDAGWELETLECRHVRFDPEKDTHPEKSTFFFRAGLRNSGLQEHLLITGPLGIEWMQGEEQGQDEVRRIDTRSLEAITSNGPPAFEPILQKTITPPENADAIDPLLVQDIDGDGLAEIILANNNLVLHHRKGAGFESRPLCTFPPGLLSTAVFTDLNGDGNPDFLCHKHEGLVVLPGSKGGIFDQYEVMLRPATPLTVYPMVLSTGDIDADGDIDIFLGQYRIPYEAGALPTPFYDANDGHPFFLLRNNGNFQFEDITASAGLDEARHRRVYSASLVDLDRRQGLDLVVVSDFAGVDLHLNNGSGTFHRAPRDYLGETRGFGMAHAFSDFNVDGHPDLLMIGMTSPTVDRLTHLNLWRPGLAEDKAMREHMTHGNRLFLSKQGKVFEQNVLSQSIARAGWAWGCTAADFDNDGFPDVYIGNGLESRESVRDYEPEYWLHDAFFANSQADPAAYLYFKEKFGRTRGIGHSYGGYESNRLFLNRSGASFLDVGHVWGLGLQRDTRNVVSEDLDGDGRMDLLMTHFEAWPDHRQILRIYRNQIQGNDNWIGFRIKREAGSPSAVGASLVIRTGNWQASRHIVTGDSYRSQHSSTLHFGLGEKTMIDQAAVKWADGHTQIFEDLKSNYYYTVSRSKGLKINDRE
jgi:enediyne biosynthesis protein E4